tara:strand:+ start:3635 stop:4399 length:765 start_codon:yes stop_codon:yes gene_type:complete
LPEETILLFNKIKTKLNIKTFDKSSYETLKITKFEKNEENINKLFKLLNKITDKTYDKLSTQIIDLIKNFDVDEKICNKFFEIIITNSIFCHLYAKLYNEIININLNYKNILQNKTILYFEKFNNIEIITPNKNYDKYCEYMKEVNNIINFTKFRIECVKYNIYSLEDIIANILYFQEMALQFINNENEPEVIDIYLSNIFLMISQLLSKIQKSDNYIHIINNNNLLIKTNKKSKNKNKKNLFKLMDISDLFIK